MFFLQHKGIRLFFFLSFWAFFSVKRQHLFFFCRISVWKLFGCALTYDDPFLVNKNHLSTWNFCIFIGHAGNCSWFVLLPVAMSFSRYPQSYKCVSSPSNYESMRITAYPPGNDHICPWKVAGKIIFPFHRWDMFFPAKEHCGRLINVPQN